MARTIVFTAFIVMMITTAAGAVEPGCYTDPDLRVIDGDSVEFQGANVRLIGFDTPEVRGHEECDEELALGERASARLRELLEAHRAIICITGTDCQFDRECGILAVRVSRQTLNVGSILISEGLAVPFTGEQGDWCE